jgi:hypothetical protein
MGVMVRIDLHPFTFPVGVTLWWCSAALLAAAAASFSVGGLAGRQTTFEISWLFI